MADQVTQEQVIEAIRSLGRDEFTRGDVAEKMGIEISAIQPSWKAVKDAGRIQRVRGEDGTRYFRLTE